MGTARDGRTRRRARVTSFRNKRARTQVNAYARALFGDRAPGQTCHCTQHATAAAWRRASAARRRAGLVCRPSRAACVWSECACIFYAHSCVSPCGISLHAFAIDFSALAWRARFMRANRRRRHRVEMRRPRAAPSAGRGTRPHSDCAGQVASHTALAHTTRGARPLTG